MANTNRITIASTPTAIGPVSVDLTLNANFVPVAKQSSVVVAMRYKWDGTGWSASDSEVKIDSNGASSLLV